MAITGGLGIMYVPANIIVVGDITATAKNMMDSELFVRLSVVSSLISQTIFVFLVIGCFSYLLESFMSFFLPDYQEIISPYLMLPLIIGEFSIIFWLLIKGVKTTAIIAD